MGRTMAEKVLTRAGGDATARPGDFVTATVDKAILHEAFALVGLKLGRLGINEVWDPERVLVVLDHYFPAPTEKMAAGHKLARALVEHYGLTSFLGHEGICHQVFVEQGHIRPGELVVGTDSHSTTCGAVGAAGCGIGVTEMAFVLALGELWFQVPPSIRFEMDGSPGAATMAKDISLRIAGEHGVDVGQYRSIEFGGPGVDSMSLAGRMTLANMGTELGAKFAMSAADERVLDHLRAQGVEGEPFGPDPDAEYEAMHAVDLDGLVPQIAFPPSPGNVRPVEQAGDIAVDQAYLGSCTNARVEDLAVAAEILRGRRVAAGTRLLVTPASRRVYREAMRLGHLEVLHDAGAHITNPGCGACPGGHLGVVGHGEVCLSSTNRNFAGRMGAREAEVYLASPATVAASAITGKVTDPREFWSATTIGPEAVTIEGAAA